MSWELAIALFVISFVAWLWLDYQLIRETYRRLRPVREIEMYWSG